jgi:hypothetical protein
MSVIIERARLVLSRYTLASLNLFHSEFHSGQKRIGNVN